MDSTVPSTDPCAARRFLFLITSARENGNTEALARHAAATLDPGIERSWVRLSDHPLPSFVDIRHEPSAGGVYPAPSGPARSLLDETLAATDLVFVVPLYWYSLPASAKLYLDHWSGWMRIPGLDFRQRMGGKTMWALTTISDDDRSAADPLFGTLQRSAAYMGMRWGGSVIGYGNRPGEALSEAGTLHAARALFRSAAAVPTGT